MYESEIRKSDPTSAEGVEALHRLRWQELVARLAATRDLRQELSQASLVELASRGRFSSLNGMAPGPSDPTVNHDGLSGGKPEAVAWGGMAGRFKDQGTL